MSEQHDCSTCGMPDCERISSSVNTCAAWVPDDDTPVSVGGSEVEAAYRDLDKLEGTMCTAMAKRLRSALEAAQAEKEMFATAWQNQCADNMMITAVNEDLEAANAALAEVAKAAQPYRSGMILDCSMANDMARRARLDEALANPAVQKALGGEE